MRHSTRAQQCYGTSSSSCLLTIARNWQTAATILAVVVVPVAAVVVHDAATEHSAVKNVHYS